MYIVESFQLPHLVFRFSSTRVLLLFVVITLMCKPWKEIWKQQQQQKKKKKKKQEKKSQISLDIIS